MNIVAASALTASMLLLSAPATAVGCGLALLRDFQHSDLGRIGIYQHSATKAIVFKSRMQVNPDGAPDAYHPDDIGTVHLCNGIRVGFTCQERGAWKAACMPVYRKARASGFSNGPPICFFAMATKNGIPVVQGSNDPMPGYFVSTTSLRQPGTDSMRPEGYLDSNTIPFAVIPSGWQRTSAPGVKLGDFGLAIRLSTGAASPMIVGDIGPENKLGEGSIALIQNLGKNPFVKRYGIRRAFSGIGERDVLYVIFPDSGTPETHVSAVSVGTRLKELSANLPSASELTACFARLR